MKKKKYVYEPEKFSIPVTKAEPLKAIQFIIDDFIDKGITFCVDGEGDSWEIWRLEEEKDTDKIKKGGSPQNPKLLYVKGEKVTDYTVSSS
jgi:hypothetical protein